MQQLGDLRDVRHARGVDVVDPEADAAGESAALDVVGDIHLRSRSFDGGDVGVESVDGVDNPTEFGVAEVGVYLGGVGGARGGKAERADGPVEVGGLVGDGQGQQLAQRGLVDLDDADAGGLEVLDLVTQGQRHLVGGVTEGLVVAHKAPGEDRDGAGEHALDGGVGEGLGERRPFDRDGFRARDIPPQDGGACAAAAVTLHPAVGGDGEPVEVLGEVLHHVVTLGFAVHEHIEADVLL